MDIIALINTDLCKLIQQLQRLVVSQLLNQQLLKLLKYQEAHQILITLNTAQTSTRDTLKEMELIWLSHIQKLVSIATQPGL